MASAQITLREKSLSSSRSGLRSRSLLLIEVGELLAFLSKLFEQRRRLPPVAMLFVKFADAIVDLLEADRVGIPHGPAAVGGEAVPVDIHHVDVHGAQRVAFVQNAGALVHQAIDAALADLLFRHRMLLHAGFSRRL